MRPRNHLDPVWLHDPERPRGLRDLRRIDPDVDLHYIGNDQWMLGSVDPNAVRREIAGRIIRQLRRRGARTPEQWRMAQLKYGGFCYIECYSTSAVRNGAVRLDLAERDFNYRHGRDVAFQGSADRSYFRRDPEESVNELITQSQEREKELGDLIMGRRQHEPMPGIDPGGALRA